MNPNALLDPIKSYLLQLHTTLCATFEQEDGQGCFGVDHWVPTSGGSGKTCYFTDGALIESSGISVSHVTGNQLPPSAIQQRPDLTGCHFEAIGLSVIIHPYNPYIPSVHSNLRFFWTAQPSMPIHWWFGGGLDLTPYYGFPEDCRHWHKTIKAACEPFGADIYPQYKKQCDDYFYLPHRQEPRGIGGIFFDNLYQWGFEKCFAFICSVGNCLLPAYLPILQQRKSLHYGERERNFQLYRRGRYVEFNLLYDRGTLFGLQSGGRTESILLSLPPQVMWRYNWRPESDTAEAGLYQHFLIARDWLSET